MYPYPLLNRQVRDGGGHTDGVVLADVPPVPVQVVGLLAEVALDVLLGLCAL